VLPEKERQRLPFRSKIRTLEKGDCRPPQAINRWITEHLHLGTAVAVSLYVSAFLHHRAPDQSLIQRLPEKLKA